MLRIQERSRERIAKYRRGLAESDFMLSLIRCIFPRIPFELHLCPTQYKHLGALERTSMRR